MHAVQCEDYSYLTLILIINLVSGFLSPSLLVHLSFDKNTDAPK